MSKVWFITGASRGMGLEITKTTLKNGDCVIATTRSENGLDLSNEYKGRF